MQHKVPTASW